MLLPALSGWVILVAYVAFLSVIDFRNLFDFSEKVLYLGSTITVSGLVLLTFVIAPLKKLLLAGLVYLFSLGYLLVKLLLDWPEVPPSEDYLTFWGLFIGCPALAGGVLLSFLIKFISK